MEGRSRKWKVEVVMMRKKEVQNNENTEKNYLKFSL